MNVVVSPHNVVNYPRGGGHFWVYLQYVQGLRRAGCDVWWLEEFRPTGDSSRDVMSIKALKDRLAPYGLQERVILYTPEREFLCGSESVVRDVFRTADLLLNFHQRIGEDILECFRLTALVDIDPGLLQYWIQSGQLPMAKHDLWFTTGVTVGKPQTKISDCGMDWIPIRPPVSLDLWPAVDGAATTAPFTTVSTWWGSEWVKDGSVYYDNNKRRSFLEFADLPRRTRVPLELALLLDPQSHDDDRDRQLLTDKGWRIRHAHDVAGSPDAYRRYIRHSRGEFSCAKPSCMKFENGWISDRSLCYLASAKPVVVQNTGPNADLPEGLGFLRFSTLDQAAAALEEVENNYAAHANAARQLAELFDARCVAESILDRCS